MKRTLVLRCGINHVTLVRSATSSPPRHPLPPMAAESSSDATQKAMATPPSAAEAPLPAASPQNPNPVPSTPGIRENAEEPKGDGPTEVGEQTGAKRVEGPVAAGSTSVVASASETVTDLDRKLRRAERFGMPVMLSEEEKRNSRAERFGTRKALTGNNNGGQAEEQKRKARAERFGLKVDVATDEEAKKKARLERFAPNLKLDTSEEDKRKARAIRFAQAPSKVSSQANTNLKATTVADT